MSDLCIGWPALALLVPAGWVIWNVQRTYTRLVAQGKRDTATIRRLADDNARLRQELGLPQ